MNHQSLKQVILANISKEAAYIVVRNILEESQDRITLNPTCTSTISIEYLLGFNYTMLTAMKENMENKLHRRTGKGKMGIVEKFKTGLTSHL